MAENAPLAQILRDVAHQTGLKLRGVEDLQQTISVHFSDATLVDGLQSLLRGVDYAILGDATSPQGIRHAQLVALARLDAAEAKAMPPAVASPQPKPDQHEPDAVGGPSPTDRSGLLRALLNRDPKQQAQAYEALKEIDPRAAADALANLVNNGEGTARLQALQLLEQDSDAPGQTVLAALRTALDSPDASLKNYAIQALAQQNSPEALDLLRQAFNDPDAETRLLVLESAAQNDQGRTLLQQALSDSDQSVSSLAAELLKAANANEPQQ